MEELVKHINDTNASYRALNAGDAKNTDLFLDNEHYELFKDSGDIITVRFNKENLSKAILFIASVLPRKYDNSAVHKTISYSSEFVLDQLAFLDGFFTVDGKRVENRIQKWNARKDVMKANGDIDKRFYFNGLLEDINYITYKGERKSAKFTIRNYFAGGYSDLHIRKANDGIFDIWITNTQTPYDDGKDKHHEIIDDQSLPLQQIFYGAPGTGKSYKVKELTGEDNVVRTTFHPDSDYSSFVGCYKPTSIEVPMRDVTGKVIVENGQKVTENRIVYEFVEQAFLQAYIKAWKMYAEDEKNPKKQYLVIEEINRGNCAQIFGDLFQLLDRGANGFSEYPIDADKDMQKHLAKAFKDMAYLEAPAIGEMSAEETARAIRSGEKLILPKNLYIWATMNTSDQSLFPIDSAFKRRWDWQYVPIHDGGKGWQIEADGKRYDWWKFVDAMNDKISTATYSEDKKLGYFFCKAKDGVIDAETFVGKVVFYIWNDVFKDFAEEAGNLFKDVDGSMLSFNKFYTIGTDGKRMVVEPKIAILMQNLGVEPITTSNSANDDEPEEDEDGNDPSSFNKNYDKFSVNGEGKWGKNRLPYECMKKYVEMNPGLNADEVLNNWKSLNVNVPHFVESKEEYESRTDKSKRSYYVKCGDTIIYVAHNGYGSNGKVYEFIAAINNANWGIKLAKVMA